VVFDILFQKSIREKYFLFTFLLISLRRTRTKRTKKPRKINAIDPQKARARPLIFRAGAPSLRYMDISY